MFKTGDRVLPAQGDETRAGEVIEVRDDEYVVRWPWPGGEETTEPDSHVAYEQQGDLRHA